MDFTQILHSAESGDASARAKLIQAAYDDLRQMAAGKMADQRQNHTLTSTALVHEVSMKMLAESQLPATSRQQFFAYASTAMRNLLIDHARTKGRQKRGGDRKQMSFEDAITASAEQRDDLLALDDALQALAELDPRKAQLVEMRYFGGLSNAEIAEALEISLATVKRDWTVAKAWLLKELRETSESSNDDDVTQEQRDGE